MNVLNLPEIIIRLRHEKGITQGQLADFVGVTKASVSKWETGQSLPDILLLPEIASFFDITVDELLGYQPQLGREEIQTIYQELAAVFAESPFEEAMKQSWVWVKRYYSCYPFLLQVSVLWLNHYMLAESEERRREILSEASDLCTRIMENCSDIGICNDAIMVRASIDLQLGRVREVITVLEELLNPYHIASQSEGVLIRAYQLTGDKEKAVGFSQFSMFLHLLAFICSAAQYMELHSEQLDICEITIQRIRQVMNVYDVEHLHPNTAAQFWYQTAIVYCMHNKEQEALEALEEFVSSIDCLFHTKGMILHGDRYFDKIETWLDHSELGKNAPRDKKLVLDSAKQALEHPAFDLLKEDPRYQKLRHVLRTSVRI